MTMSLDELSTWYRHTRGKTVPEPKVMELYFQFHPRTAFVKTLPRGAALLDVGAGDGSLAFFRDWPEPARPDLKMYAYSLEKGTHFDRFDGYEISDWEAAPPQFPGLLFDGIVCAHFIEHISQPASFIRWAAEKLADGGRVYVEWPSPASERLPSLQEARGAGLSLVISRYHDDNTHQNAIPDRAAVADMMRLSGLEIEAQGIIRLPWLEDELMAHYREADDPFPRQAAFWSRTGWAQYIVASKPSGVRR